MLLFKYPLVRITEVKKSFYFNLLFTKTQKEFWKRGKKQGERVLEFKKITEVEISKMIHICKEEIIIII